MPSHQGQGSEESHRCESFEAKHVEAGRWAQEPTDQEKGTEGISGEPRPSPVSDSCALAHTGDVAGKIQCRVANDYLHECPYQTWRGLGSTLVIVKHLRPRLEAQ